MCTTWASGIGGHEGQCMAAFVPWPEQDNAQDGGLAAEGFGCF